MAVLKIGIAGAGLLGRLLAWRLSRLGHRVSVFDPARDAHDRAQAAGWTAAGMLSPWAELHCGDGALARLALRSLDLWAEVLGELPQAVHFRRAGSLLLAHRGDLGAAQRLIGPLQAKMPAGRAPRSLTPDELHQLEPALHGPLHAWLLADEGQIHAPQAMQALAAGASLRGVCWCWERTVHEVAPGCIDGECFDTVFDVRGVGARPDLPVRGVRGEIVWLHAPGVALNRPVRLLHPRSRTYLVPRPDDMLGVGASEIESEDRSAISVRTLLELLGAAHSVVPELAEARVVRTETNLRPALPDNLPQVESCHGLTRINGLFRHGWSIAPALVQDALGRAGLLAVPELAA